MADWYDGYSAETEVDPWGPPSGEVRVMRGGGFRFSVRFAHAAYRDWFSPGNEVVNVGFRVVLPGARSR